MTRVEVAQAAVEDLDRLIRTHSLPADTRERVRETLHALERFPLLGPALIGWWEGIRFVLGPWRWMLMVDVIDTERDVVTIVTIQDARSSAAVRPD